MNMWTLHFLQLGRDSVPAISSPETVTEIEVINAKDNRRTLCSGRDFIRGKSPNVN